MLVQGQLRLDVVEDPAPLPVLWTGMDPSEQAETVRVLSRLISKIVIGHSEDEPNG